MTDEALLMQCVDNTQLERGKWYMQQWIYAVFMARQVRWRHACCLRRAISSRSRSSTMLSGCAQASGSVLMGTGSSRLSGTFATSVGQTAGDTGRDDSLDEFGVMGGLPVSGLPPTAAVMFSFLDSCKQPALCSLRWAGTCCTREGRKAIPIQDTQSPISLTQDAPALHQVPSYHTSY